MELHKNVVKGLGVLFLIAMAASIAGNLTIVNFAKQSNYLDLIDSNKLAVGIACVLLLTNSLSVALIGVLSFPLLENKSEILARGYLVFRVMESVVLLIGVISLMVLIPLSEMSLKGIGSSSGVYELVGRTLMKTNWYAYLTGMIILGISGTVFCHFLLKNRVIPNMLSILGIVGYLILCITSVVSIIGPTMDLYVTLPVFLFKVMFGIWLIVAGIDSKQLLNQANA